MKLVIPVESMQEFNRAIESGVQEILVGTKDLSRFGKLEWNELNEILALAKQRDIRCILEWDILMTQVEYLVKCQELAQRDLELFDAIRVQDLGALTYALEQTNLPIQLVLETGNHNILGMKKWVELVGKRLDRLVLSYELPETKLLEVLEEVDCPLELLGLGRILLFYTPRKLLSPLELEKKMQQTIELYANSEESAHKNFPVLENQHGTFMFHLKDFDILEQWVQSPLYDFMFIRIDTRFDGLSQDIQTLALALKNKDSSFFQSYKKTKNRPSMRGFYHINKTDVLFSKLKNYRVARRDKNFIGHVMDAKKNRFMAIKVKTPRGLHLGDELLIQTPEGKEKKTVVTSLKNAQSENVTMVAKDHLAILPGLSAIGPKSVVYYQTVTNH